GRQSFEMPLNTVVPQPTALDADAVVETKQDVSASSRPVKITAEVGPSASANGPLRLTNGGDASPAASTQLEAVPGTPGGMTEGWFTWYWGRGLNLMYWRRWSDDRLTVVALPRARWMADLLALLP